MNRAFLTGFIAIFPEKSLSIEEVLLWSCLLFFVSTVCVVFGIFYIIKLWIDRAQYRKNHKEHQQISLKIEKQMREIAEKVKRVGCHQEFLDKSDDLYYLVEECLSKHTSDTKTNNLIGALETLQTLSPIMDEVEKIADYCVALREKELDLLRWGDEAPIH